LARDVQDSRNLATPAALDITPLSQLVDEVLCFWTHVPNNVCGLLTKSSK
jgi:hypothetical protein